MATNTVNIQINLNDGGAYERLKEMKSIVDAFKNTKINIDIHGQLNSIQNTLKRLESSLDNINGKSKTTVNVDDKGLQQAADKGQQVVDKMHEISGQEAEVRVNADSADTAVSKLQQVASVLGEISSLASSVGTVFSGLGDFSNMFGQAFSGMAGLFQTNLVEEVGRGLINMGTQAIVGQIGGTLSRYDIMNTFIPYMELAGVDQYTAERSLNRVDQSIRGIPIGLDEAAFRLRKYQMYLNDINRATDFTIGIQKAIMAGGASQSMQTQAYMQIDRLLATGKLGQSRQWLSLFNGLGVSLKFLREELALDPSADLKTIATDLANGTIATEDFIRAIERLSRNEGLDQALSIYKGTIEAWTSNIQNAIKRGGQGILESVNTVMETTYSTGITGMMEKVRDQIDVVSKEAKEYIIGHPRNIQIIGDIVQGLFQRIGGLDASGFVDKLFTNIRDIGETAFKVFDSIPKGFLEDFSSFALTWAGPMSMIFKAVNSGLPQMLGVFERVKGMDMGEVIGKITGQIENMAGAISKVLGLLNDDTLGDIMAFGLVWGKPIANILGAVAQQLGAMTLALQNPLVQSALQLLVKTPSGIASLLMGGAGSGFGGALAGLGVAGLGAAAIIGGGTLYRNHWEKKWAEEVLADTTLESAETQMQSAEDIMNLVRQHDREMEDSRKALESNKSYAKELVDDIYELGRGVNYAFGDERVEQIAKLQGKLHDLYQLVPELNLGIDQSTGLLDENSAALLGMADLYIELQEAQDRAELIGTDTETKQNDIRRMRASIADTDQQIAAARSNLNRLENERATWDERNLSAPDTFSEEVVRDATRYGSADERIQLDEKIEKQQQALDDLIKTRETQFDQLMDEQAAMYGLSQEADAAAESIAGVNAELDKMARSEEERAIQQQRIEEMEEYYRGVRDQIKETLASQVSVLEPYEAPALEDQPQLASVIANAKSYEDALVEYEKDVKTVTDYIIQAATQAATESEREFYRPGLDLISSLGVDAPVLIDQLAADIIGASTDAEAKQRVEDFFSSLNVPELMQTSAAEMLGNAAAAVNYGEEWTKHAEENPEIFSDLTQTITDGLFDMLDSVETSFEEDGALAEKVRQLSEVLNGTFEANFGTLDGEGEGGGIFSTMTSGFEQLNQQLTSLTEIDLSGYTSALEEVSGAQEEVSSSANEANTQISVLANTATSRTGSFSSLIGSIGNVAGVANSAASAVNALVNAIASLRDKTVNVRVNTSGSVASLPGSGTIIPRGNAEGGYAGTGRLLLGPTGTDVIPTYLSHGEFVIKQRAARMLGSNFLYKINNMDIGGAFDALMRRLAVPTNMPFGNTYNRDNHAVVNNYFSGETGQGYSQRKAYKFARGL